MILFYVGLHPISTENTSANKASLKDSKPGLPVQDDWPGHIVFYKYKLIDWLIFFSCSCSVFCSLKGIIY